MKPIKLGVGQLLVRTSPNDDDTLSQQVQWLNDPEVVRYSEQRHRIHTLESQLTYYNLFTGSNLFLSINIGSEQIGTLTVYTDDYNNVANVGIMVGDKSRWGLGYGQDAWKVVCNYLLQSGTRKIEAGCAAINNSMMSICRRYAMIEEGRQKDHFLIEGFPSDLIHWRKFK